MSQQMQPLNLMSYYLRGGTGCSNSLTECVNGASNSLFGYKSVDQLDKSGNQQKTPSKSLAGIITSQSFSQKQLQQQQQSYRKSSNPYVISVTEQSCDSIMTANDIQLQRKSLTELSTQQSHIKDISRNINITDTLYSSVSPSKQSFHKKVDSLKQLTQNANGNYNTSPHQLLESSRRKTGAVSMHTDEPSQLFFKGANRSLFKSAKAEKHNQIQTSSINKAYLAQMNSEIGPFQSLVHGFAVNDTLLLHTNEIQEHNQQQPQQLQQQKQQQNLTQESAGGSPLFFTEPSATERSNYCMKSETNSCSQQDQDKSESLKGGDEKDEVMVLMLDLLRELEKPFKEGMSGQLYPRTDMIRFILEELLQFSNKAIKYLSGIGETATCLCINSLLKMFAQIFSKQEARVSVEVKRRVDLEVEQTTLQLQFLKRQNKDLTEQLNAAEKELETREKQFKVKINNLEELRNEQTEIANILKEQIDDFRTKKYKDSQLEMIQHSSKEILKQCAILDAELVKSKNAADDSLFQLAKLAADKAVDLKQDLKHKGFFQSGNISPGFHPKMQTYLQDRATFDDQSVPIVFAEKYDAPESKAAFLFQHPFFFYLQPDISNCLYDRFLPKMTRPQIAGYLEDFLDQEDFLRIGGTRLNAPTNFVAQVLQEEKDFFKGTVRIQEICGLVKAALDNQKQQGFFFANVFGIFQENMLTDSQFELILTLRKQLKENNSIFQKTQDQQFQQKLLEDEVYITQQSFAAAFSNAFRSHPNFTKLSERFQLFLSTKRMQINQRAIQEQRKVGVHSLFSNESSSLVLVPNLMEKLKTENINDVLHSLENIFERLDLKKNLKVNYQSFKRLMNNHFGIDTEDPSSSEYFRPFIEDDNFNYIAFMNKITAQHVPEALNDQLIPYYVALNEIANILILTQNQSFHDFKNKLSNLLFSKRTPALFCFSLIEDFFKEYEDSHDNLLQYNTKRITPAILYQNIFIKNEWISLYNVFRQEGKIEKPNEDTFLQLYPKEELINNFTSYMDYLRHIYSFLLVQEKIQIYPTTIPPTETSISAPSSNKLIRPRGITQQKSTVGKMKSLQLRQQDSTMSIKSQPTAAGIKKSQFLMQTSIQQQSSERDLSDLQESPITPVSTTKKSQFAQI